jgi:RNA 2',3'-cyclic 3'-phosphodiesterase
VRVFAGVELDERVRLACAEAARELDERVHSARSRLTVRWIPEDNLHITLWFFGEVSDARAAEIADRLRVGWEIPAFALTISGVGVFPSRGPIRIVWLGVAAGTEAMAAIHRELTARLAPLALEPERRAYHPHVTLGRAKESTGSPERARALLERGDLQVGSCDVKHITLFQSRLSPRGARYEPLLRVPLKH